MQVFEKFGNKRDKNYEQNRKVLAGANYMLAFVFLGNILPKCNQNKMLGIRTKWTLENETVWYKTRRFGGRLLSILGAVSAILCATILDDMAAFFVAFGRIVLISVPSIVYSYVIYKGIPKDNESC